MAVFSEDFNVSDLVKIAEKARGTGFISHDLRDAERFESQRDISKIHEIDRAFLKAAESLQIDFWQAAAYAESGVALEDTDKLADVVLEPNNTDNDKIEFKQGTNVYETAFRWYRKRLKAFVDGMKEDVAKQAQNYWGEFE